MSVFVFVFSGSRAAALDEENVSRYSFGHILIDVFSVFFFVSGVAQVLIVRT